MKICGVIGTEDCQIDWEKAVDLHQIKVMLYVRDELEKCIKQGAEEFAIAMDNGLGLMAASMVMVLKKQYPNIRLTCLMRWEEQAADWPEADRTLWFAAFED